MSNKKPKRKFHYFPHFKISSDNFQYQINLKIFLNGRKIKSKTFQKKIFNSLYADFTTTLIMKKKTYVRPPS